MTHRHQRGWLKKEKRSQGETWVLFFRTVRKSDGKRVENKIPIGLLKDFSSKSCAWAEVLGPHGMSSDPGKALPGNQVTSIFEDHAGRSWAGMMNRLFVYERGRFREITKMNGSAAGMVIWLTTDPS